MTSTSDSCKDGASKTNGDGVCEVNNMLHNMSTADNIVVSICANCGKEGSVNNTCNKCNMVKYCNAVCKKKHKKKHKKECEENIRLAAECAAKLREEELKLAAEKHDTELFKQPPPADDCPICLQQLPSKDSGSQYMTCCGKVVCSGCAYAPVYDNQGNKIDDGKCAFCRSQWSKSNQEIVKRLMKRVEMNDPFAIHDLGNHYRDGMRGFPQDYTKALKYWHQAAELGFAKANNSIGIAYINGVGVEVDKKKAKHYWELAAIGGNPYARYNLGLAEEGEGDKNRAQHFYQLAVKAGYGQQAIELAIGERTKKFNPMNKGKADGYDRAIKHYMIAVGRGHAESLDHIKELYSLGFATKDDYMKALQAYQAYLGEIKSSQRDEAAACFRYYYYGHV